MRLSGQSTEVASEVLFYHLERQPLDRVLPTLVERTVERGWRAVVQAGTEERLEAIDTLLWTYRDDSFLAHGTDTDGPAADQPVFLTTKEDNPNGAAVRFLVDGAKLAELKGYLRIVLIFDGRDPTAVALAREQWKLAKAQGCATTYWKQTAEGRWQREG
jgi:DNA polymerase-3 subunit chi